MSHAIRLTPGQTLKEGFVTLIESTFFKTEKQEKASETSEKKQELVKNNANPKYHIVKKGDSLYAIAKRYHTTIAILCKLNKIDENSLLQIGQKIKLPQRK